ncbi:MAG: P44/Msp2 family outer membrane protein [Candidatus Abyssobacteria bacterium SURF_5]|uniref:P44/Msp2 family outer membrane protein n=1 Tax=Abyssobacteria bacterium (strain SURF_5) TaxID=2093360 RepID=A0A3A4NZQ0_ABYX5|nr:MAG: P44/Msp2 family outer membrane protein [Candidatus Abyssubacteria bacterium SURF_5]
MKKTFLILLISLLFVPAFVSDAYAVQQEGDVELAVVAASVSYLELDVDDDDGALVLEDVDIEDEQTQLLIGLRLSTYMTREWQAGVGITGAYNFDTDNAAIAADGFLNYNFVTEGSTVVPYIGVGGGGSYVEVDDEDDFSPQAGGQAGVKFYIADNINLFAEFNYRYLFIDEGDIDGAHNVAGLFGVGVLF